jgi:hypothetical protein
MCQLISEPVDRVEVPSVIGHSFAYRSYPSLASQVTRDDRPEDRPNDAHSRVVELVAGMLGFPQLANL